MHQEKLKQLANANKELWFGALKELENEVADIRRGTYTTETRKAVCDILDNFMQRVSTGENSTSKDIEDWR
jgi:hypothetical protein